MDWFSYPDMQDHFPLLGLAPRRLDLEEDMRVEQPKVRLGNGVRGLLHSQRLHGAWSLRHTGGSVSFTCFLHHNQGWTHFCSSCATLREKTSGAWVGFSEFASTQMSECSAFRSGFSHAPGQNNHFSWWERRSAYKGTSWHSLQMKNLFCWEKDSIVLCCAAQSVQQGVVENKEISDLKTHSLL